MIANISMNIDCFVAIMISKWWVPLRNLAMGLGAKWKYIENKIITNKATYNFILVNVAIFFIKQLDDVTNFSEFFFFFGILTDFIPIPRYFNISKQIIETVLRFVYVINIHEYFLLHVTLYMIYVWRVFAKT